MILGPMVRGVHEDPQRYGSTGTPSHIIGIEDIDNDRIIGMDKKMSQLPALRIPGRPSPQKTGDGNNGQMVRRVHEDPERYGSTKYD